MTYTLSGAGELSLPRRLLLMRHAAAEFGADSDHERPLSVEGRAQAQAVGQRLRAEQSLPQLILCSSALRTRTTKDLLLAQWGEVAAQVSVEVRDDLYEARPRQVVELLRTTTDERASVLVIGHEPTMSMLAALLAQPESDEAALRIAQVGFMTAGIATLDIASNWGELEPRAAFLRAIQPPPPR